MDNDPFLLFRLDSKLPEWKSGQQLYININRELDAVSMTIHNVNSMECLFDPTN